MVIDYRALNRQTVKNNFFHAEIRQRPRQTQSRHSLFQLVPNLGVPSHQDTPEDNTKTAFRNPIGLCE
jgi:hypothetical protein